MNLLSGDAAVKSIYAGSQKVWRAYQGSSKIWALYKVSFKDWDDTVLKYQEVVHGNQVAPPPNPTRDGYEFVQWGNATPIDGIDEDQNVVSDVSLYAIYQKNEDPVDPIQPMVGTLFGSGAQSGLSVGWNSQVNRTFQLLGGYRYRITLDKMHFCHAETGAHGLGASFAVLTNSVITSLTAFLLDDSMTQRVQAAEEPRLAVYTSKSVSKDSSNAYYPKTFTRSSGIPVYDYGYQAFQAATGVVGPTGAYDTTGGTTFIFETNQLAEDTQLTVTMNPVSVTNSACRQNKKVYCNARYVIEAITAE